MPLFQITLLTQSHLPASKHQFLDDTKIKISSKKWCLLSGKWLHVSKVILQSGIFFYYFYDILFYILGSIGLVHWVEPITWLRHGVCNLICLILNVMWWLVECLWCNFEILMKYFFLHSWSNFLQKENYLK